MKKEVILKFIDEAGNRMEVGAGKDWSFARNSGLTDFATFEGVVAKTENYFRGGYTVDNIRLSGKVRVIRLAYVKPYDNDVERDRFTQFFKWGKRYKLYVTYMGRTRWAECILTRMQMSEDTQVDRLMTVTMSLTFESAFWLSVDDFGKNIADVVPYFAFPWISPVGIGTTAGVFSFKSNVKLTNDGDANAYPIVQIKAYQDVTNPVVYINDAFVRFKDVLPAGETLTMNFEATPPTIRIGERNVLGKCDRQSTFDEMYLAMGENLISYSADDGADEMEVFVKYNAQYTVI